MHQWLVLESILITYKNKYPNFHRKSESSKEKVATSS